MSSFLPPKMFSFPPNFLFSHCVYGRIAIAGAPSPCFSSFSFLAPLGMRRKNPPLTPPLSLLAFHWFDPPPSLLLSR